MPLAADYWRAARTRRRASAYGTPPPGSCCRACELAGAAWALAARPLIAVCVPEMGRLPNRPRPSPPCPTPAPAPSTPCRKVPKKVTNVAFTADGRHMLASDKFGDVLAAATEKPAGQHPSRSSAGCRLPLWSAALVMTTLRGVAEAVTGGKPMGEPPLSKQQCTIGPPRPHPPPSNPTLPLPLPTLQAWRRASSRSRRSCWATTAPSSRPSPSPLAAASWPPPTGAVMAAWQHAAASYGPGFGRALLPLLARLLVLARRRHVHARWRVLL